MHRLAPEEHRRHRPWHAHTSEVIYAYRTRKPGAVWGLPLVGRHWAYVGRTNDLARRHQEHILGGGMYDAVAKPWADLEPRLYVIRPKKRRREWTTNFLEWFFIWLLLPVYNVSMNAGNPRRIRRAEQLRQRAARDRSEALGVVVGLRRRVPVYAGVAVALVAALAAWQPWLLALVLPS